MRGDLLPDPWLQSIHECSKCVCHRHRRNPQLEVTKVLDIILYKARLAQSLQLLPCLLLFCDGGEGRSNFPSEVPLVRLGCPVTCTDTGLLRLEPAAGTLLQPSTSKVDPLASSAWEQLQPICSLLQLVPDNRESLSSELRWGLQFHMPTNSSHCRYRAW